MKAIIVDDEKLAIEAVENALDASGFDVEITKFNNAKNALKTIMSMSLFWTLK